MRMKISEDEIYPVFGLEESGLDWVPWYEFSEEEVEFIKKAMEDFYRAQSIMGEKVDEEKRLMMGRSKDI